MNRKKIIIVGIVAAVLAAGTGGYFYYQKFKKAEEVDAIQNAGNVAEDLGKQAAQGVLPSIGTNPLENKPDVNPVSKTNPFSDIKTNPFK